MASEITNVITKAKTPRKRKGKKQQQDYVLVQSIDNKPTGTSRQSKWIRTADNRMTQAPMKTAVSLINNSLTISQANRLRSTGNNDFTALGGQKGIAISEEELKALFPNAMPWEGDPYDEIDKDQFHEAARTDGMVKRALKFMITFLMGKEHPTTELQTNTVFRNDDDKATALESIQSNDQFQKWKLTIDEIDQETDFYNRLKAALFNCFTYGRAVLVKLYNSDGLPVRVIPLSSRRLGKVWVDSQTWEFIAVEYLDYPDERRLLLADDIIYFAMDDYNVTPNSLYHGLSWLEPVAWISEANRVMHQKDIPEIVEKFWAPAFLVESMTMDDEENKAIIEAIEPGKTVLVRGAAKIQQVRYDAPIHDVVALSDLQNMKILRDMSVPLLAGGFENIQNRAVALTVIQQWGESTPQELREWLRNILEKQWYEKNLRTVIDVDVRQCDGCLFDMLGLTAPDTETQDADKTPEQRLQEKQTFDLTGRVKYPFKIGVLFSEIVVDTFLDRTAAVVGLHQAGLINDDIALEIGNLGKFTERMRLERQQEEVKRMEQMQAELDAIREGQQAGNQQQQRQPFQSNDVDEDEDNSSSGGTPIGARLGGRLRT